MEKKKRERHTKFVKEGKKMRAIGISSTCFRGSSNKKVSCLGGKSELMPQKISMKQGGRRGEKEKGDPGLREEVGDGWGWDQRERNGKFGC